MVSLLNTPPGRNAVRLDRNLCEEALRVVFRPIADLLRKLGLESSRPDSRMVGDRRIDGAAAGLVG